MLNIIRDGGVSAALGFNAAAIFANVKGKGRERPDFAVLISSFPCKVAALFTSNLVKAAPVRFSMERLAKGGEFYGALVNSGNANACTGEAGFTACANLVKGMEKLLKTPENSLLAASTGVIGTPFPEERLSSKLKELAEAVEQNSLNHNKDDGDQFAKAIMTTDTVQKEFAVLVESSSGAYVVGGAVKGVGMLAPELATMLAFITTDAEVSEAELKEALSEAAADSFNAITVDGDMSTNDTLFLFANGASGVKPDKGGFKDALKLVCLELAKKLARDGEGAEKFVTLRVTGAKSRGDAVLAAKKMANSPLVKTMFAGADPNWGRLLAAAGASGAIFDPLKTAVYFDGLAYVKDGALIDAALEKEACEIMRRREYEITIDLGAGDGVFTCYTCDLTREYIAINADYRS